MALEEIFFGKETVILINTSFTWSSGMKFVNKKRGTRNKESEITKLQLANEMAEEIFITRTNAVDRYH